MNISKCILFSISTLCAATSAFGWGDEGHETVGAIADHLIQNTPAQAHVRALLGDETLATAAIWADQARGFGPQTPEMLQFAHDNTNHTQSHYTDIPFQEAHYRDDSVGASKIDVVHAINACILILQGKPDDQSVFTNVNPKIALRLLAHYTGDIHQPLHVGAGYIDGTNFVNPNTYTGHWEGDQGGNWLMRSARDKLHYFWDVTAVRGAMTNANAADYHEYADYLLARPAPKWKTSDNYMNWSREWADDSLAISGKVHELTLKAPVQITDQRTGRLHSQWRVVPIDPHYNRWAEETASRRIQLAGYRLAGILEALWPDK